MSLFIKKFTVLIFFFIFLFRISSVLFAQNTSQAELDLRNKIQQYEEKLKTIRDQKNTLSSQIQYMDTQIALTEFRIAETEQNIVKTEKEISILNDRIEGLDTSLDYLTKQLVHRVIEGYKNREPSLFDLLLDSEDASKLIDRLKYEKTARNNNQKLLIQVQTAKLNFEEQKNLREEKKAELDELNATLQNQKKDLNAQKLQKQKLLADTQNDEATYQSLLSQAQQQLSAFKSFVISAGAGIISANQFGSGSDGNYFSQRDERWANKTIGYSSESILDVGCLLTSVAMAAKKYGSSITPLDIASDVERFWGNTAWMRLPWPGVAGRSYQPVSNIDEELQNGNYVIVGIRRSSCANGGDHFVVLIKKDGNDYIMHDPIYGPDIKFNTYYNTICSSATFK